MIAVLFGRFVQASLLDSLFAVFRLDLIHHRPYRLPGKLRRRIDLENAPLPRLGLVGQVTRTHADEPQRLCRKISIQQINSGLVDHLGRLGRLGKGHLASDYLKFPVLHFDDHNLAVQTNFTQLPPHGLGLP